MNHPVINFWLTLPTSRLSNYFCTHVLGPGPVLHPLGGGGVDHQAGLQPRHREVHGDHHRLRPGEEG